MKIHILKMTNGTVVVFTHNTDADIPNAIKVILNDKIMPSSVQIC